MTDPDPTVTTATDGDAAGRLILAMIAVLAAVFVVYLFALNRPISSPAQVTVDVTAPQPAAPPTNASNAPA